MKNQMQSFIYDNVYHNKCSIGTNEHKDIYLSQDTG